MATSSNSRFTGNEWSYRTFMELHGLAPNFRKLSKRNEKGELEPVFCTEQKGDEIVTTDVQRVGMWQNDLSGKRIRVVLCREYCTPDAMGKIHLPSAEASVAEQTYETTDPEGNPIVGFSYLVKPFYRDDNSVDVVLD